MFSVTIYPVYFRFFLCYNDKDERQKYGVIEDSNKKAEKDAKNKESTPFEPLKFKLGACGGEKGIRTLAPVS